MGRDQELRTVQYSSSLQEMGLGTPSDESDQDSTLIAMMLDVDTSLPLRNRRGSIRQRVEARRDVGGRGSEGLRGPTGLATEATLVHPLVVTAAPSRKGSFGFSSSPLAG